MNVNHALKATQFVSDEKKASWHDETLWHVRYKRDLSSKGLPEWEQLREMASAIKANVLSHLDDYLIAFERKAIENGIQVHWAADAAEHNHIANRIIQENGAKKVVKSKSMLTEECQLNPYLKERGIEVVDTDLGERIVQLAEAEEAQMAEAVEKAKQADVIIAVVGEDEQTVGESLSRTSLDLPGHQEKLLQALHATGKPVIVVLINGRPLTINWADEHLPAILEAWFPGPSSGIAVAEAIFGDYNPGGKLPVTFPKSAGQLEYNFPFKPGSHADQPASGNNGYGKTRVNGPLYPFGHGLSYTTFEYENLVISPESHGPKGEINVQVEVKNTGKVKGDEVVQLYVQDKLSSVTTYESQLRGFERVSLEPGQRKTVKFRLTPDDLSLYDRNMNYVVEPGEFEVRIGSSSEDIRLKGHFVIKE